MKLLHNVSGDESAAASGRMGYRVTRQTGSHILLMRAENRQHHVAMPVHNPLRVGILSAVVADVGANLGIAKDEWVERLILDDRYWQKNLECLFLAPADRPGDI